MILSIIISVIVFAILAILFIMYRNSNINNPDIKTSQTKEKQHCYALSIEGDDTGIYVLSSTKLSEEDLKDHKTRILNKLYNDNPPSDLVVGVVYMGLMDTEDK